MFSLRLTDEDHASLAPWLAAHPGPQGDTYTLERDKSRIVGCIPGHYTWTFDDPLFRVLVLRSICWAAAEEDVDRLAGLATVGARLD